MAEDHAPVPVDVVLHPDLLLDDASVTREVLRALRGKRARSAGAVVVQRRTVDARRGKVRVRVRALVHHRDHPPTAPVYRPAALPQLAGAPVAIVGAGPAGLFCAWALARVSTMATRAARS